jgi:IPT/TIG domain
MIHRCVIGRLARIPLGYKGHLLTVSCALLLQVDNPKISAIEIVKVSDHAAHALTGGPYSAVDLDASGSELVRVDASESHTHGVGNVLVSHTWKLGDTIIGTGAVTSLNIPVGEHEVELTVTDKAGTVNSDKTTITVKVRGFPELFSLSPTSGAVSGGTTVTLTGQDIGSATSVRFGRAAVTNIRVINSSTITVVTPEAAVGVPVAVSVVTPVGESSPQRYVYESVAPISFAIQELFGISLPTAVAFGPDGKLYVGTYGGKLARFTLNDSYDKVVSSVIADRFPNNGKMCILGIAFDPLETPELGDQISVYISLSEVYHGQYRNRYGLATAVVDALLSLESFRRRFLTLFRS